MLLVIGERGQVYARERGYEPVSLPGIQDEGRYAQAMELRDYCVEHVLTGRLGSVTVVYPRAVSFTHQRVETLACLPCRAWAPEPSAGQIAPLLESLPVDLVAYLVSLWMGEKFYQVFGVSRLAELAARAVHLEGSSQELQTRRRKLQLEYFRGRHELVDQNMRELFTARVSHGRAHA